MAIYRSDARCTACKNWVTVYVTADAQPTKDAAFQFLCTCNRVVSGTGGTFGEVKNLPYGALVAELTKA